MSFLLSLEKRFGGEYNEHAMKVFMNTVLITAILLLGYGLYRMRFRGDDLARELALLEAQIVSFVGENEELERGIDHYSNSENVEREARARLNMIKPGEKLIIITLRNGNDAIQEDATSTKVEEKETPWEKFKKFFGF
ncbi:MAG: hypothetical protein A2939_00490 [Parcubacteria group bacterium RIFCSPLOWO2_01_FULL_48_18]|nr:MAG: hypothetical protein A3J67_05635 [Parcubacteria group bacterium RIFCSPHIGHO2_02_FULL_48_10b]OHB21960.1 MAG: hypothetical protein A2939_00490 [Parcubacteria group bacterium RIFCSPLOWO2_01_FULL_48_18]